LRARAKALHNTRTQFLGNASGGGSGEGGAQLSSGVPVHGQKVYDKLAQVNHTTLLQSQQFSDFLAALPQFFGLNHKGCPTSAVAGIGLYKRICLL
jgi:hypothetical protein